MSDSFLEELDIGNPDHFLGIGSGTHAVQTARVMERLEPLLIELEPDLVLVPGDVNSTLAAALVAAKLDIPIGHVEAGLRSFDRSMPEEVNRVVTDQLADLLFTHSPEARKHLEREGRSDADIYAVGNTMIDTLVAMRHRMEVGDAPRRHALSPGGYILVTLHRPALVDGPLLPTVMAELEGLARHLDVIFPVHPRTRARLDDPGFASTMRLLEPMGYLEFLGLMASAAAVLTDSGGIQEETTYLGVPCFTLRDTTERPVTCQLGTNVLLGSAPDRIADIPEILRTWGNRGTRRPEGWDGLAAERLVDVLAQRDSYRAWVPPVPPAYAPRAS